LPSPPPSGSPADDTASVWPVDLPATTVAPAPSTTVRPTSPNSDDEQTAAGIDVSRSSGGNTMVLVALLPAGACVTAALLALLLARRRQQS
jgi:hypothetical protein